MPDLLTKMLKTVSIRILERRLGVCIHLVLKAYILLLFNEVNIIIKTLQFSSSKGVDKPI